MHKTILNLYSSKDMYLSATLYLNEKYNSYIRNTIELNTYFKTQFKYGHAIFNG